MRKPLTYKAEEKRGAWAEKDEITRSCRKLYNEEVHNLYSPPSIFRMMKSRRMRCEGQVAHMGRREIYMGFSWERQKKRDH
jgi:hypothetical protein